MRSQVCRASADIQCKDTRGLTMKGLFNQDLVSRFGFTMAVFIAATTSSMQRGIDATNAERTANGRKLLENASVEEVIGTLQRNGLLPA